MKFLMAMFGIAALIAIAAYFVFVALKPNPDPVVEGPVILQTEAQFRDKVAELKRDRERLLNAMQRLENRKQETLDFLRDKGVTSSADITDDKDVKYALNNLKGWKTEIEGFGTQVAKYDEAINSIVAMLDKLERERLSRDVALSEEQLIDLRKIVVDLDERLDIRDADILADEELGQILDEEMEADKQEAEDPAPVGC